MLSETLFLLSKGIDIGILDLWHGPLLDTAV